MTRNLSDDFPSPEERNDPMQHSSRQGAAFPFRPLFVGGAVGVLCAIGFLSGALTSWSDRVSDRLFVPRTPDPVIVLVTIDDDALQRVGRWPWDRTVHADLIREITRGAPAAIGYDVNFPEPQDDENDAALASAIREAGNVVIPAEIQFVPQGSRQASRTLLAGPDTVAAIPAIRGAAAGIGYTNFLPDVDGVVRATYPWVESADPFSSVAWTPFAMQIAPQAARAPEGALPGAGRERLRIWFPGPPRHTFPVISAADVLARDTDPSAFAGKIVLVGATAPDLHDEQLTPVGIMSGVEIHASVLDAYLQGRWLHTVPAGLVAALLVLIGLVCGLVIPSMRTRWNGPLCFFLWAGTLFAVFLSFDRGWILDAVWPTLAFVAGYAAVTLERRITAERERRELKTAFSRYVSPSVVESIMRDPSSLHLGGQRKRMTVLFSDVRGFTTLSEHMDPEHLVQVLNTCLDRMTQVIFEQEGVLDKYIGDAVMAFWNAPFDQPDHGLRAVRAALGMRDALRDLNAQNAFGGVSLRMGMGIETGDMVVGNIGGATRFDYTVIGDKVNLASRLEGVTKEYGVEILVTDAVRRELGSEILTRRLDKIAVKGRKEPFVVFEAMERSETATREQKRLARDFEAALDLYFSRRFAEAVTACDLILTLNHDDGPAKTLRERAQRFHDDAPPDDWDGTWVYTKK